MTAGVSMYRSILRRLAKLERAGEAELSFRTPVSHAVDVARRAEVTCATTSNHHVDALRATLPWLEGQEDGGGRGTFSVSRMRAIARDMFKNSAEEGSASKALDAYIVLIQQSRLQVCSTTVFHEPTSTRFEAWSSPIEDPFGGPGRIKSTTTLRTGSGSRTRARRPSRFLDVTFPLKTRAASQSSAFPGTTRYTTEPRASLLRP